MEYTLCDLCKNDKFSVLYRMNIENEEFTLVKCTSCGLVFLNPQPNREEMPKYYPADTYYAYQEMKKPDFREKLKTFIMESGYKKDFKVWRKVVFSLLGQNLMTFVPSKPHGRILDVGCGNGAHLKWMKEHGWETYGLDINAQACKIAEKNGIETFCGELEEANYPDNSFDVVTMNQVLEHVHSPCSCLKEAYRVLKDEGLLIVCVPNIDSYESKILKKYWPDLDVPRHLFHFNLETLKYLLERNTFYVEKIRSKNWGLPFSRTGDTIKKMMSSKNPNFGNLSGFLMATKWLILILLVKPLAFVLSSKKEVFGSYISLQTRKNKTNL